MKAVCLVAAILGCVVSAVKPEWGWTFPVGVAFGFASFLVPNS